jgi:transcriptional regulator with XRE-family HTH domain
VRSSPYRRAFGERLRALREEAGFSQESFAHRVGIDRTYQSGLERGIRNPSLDVLVKLAAGLGVQPVDLLSTLPDVDRSVG